MISTLNFREFLCSEENTKSGSRARDGSISHGVRRDGLLMSVQPSVVAAVRLAQMVGAIRLMATIVSVKGASRTARSYAAIMNWRDPASCLEGATKREFRTIPNTRRDLDKTQIGSLHSQGFDPSPPDAGERGRPQLAVLSNDVPATNPALHSRPGCRSRRRSVVP